MAQNPALTQDQQDPQELYWRDIKDNQPLSRQEEYDLFQRVRAGDEQARQCVITANLRFVVSIAREYNNYKLSLVELISEGNMGLLEAVKRFDETRGFKFITYAVWWIRQAILNVLAQHGRIARPPMSHINDLQKIEKEAAKIAQRLGRDPTFEEIVAKVDISTERTRNALDVNQQDLSFEAPAFNGGETTLLDVFPAHIEGADDEVERTNMEQTLSHCLENLDAREYHIVRSYFGLEDLEPMTLEEIGGAMGGITRERVRQLRNSALKKMRDCCGDVLKEFSNNTSCSENLN